MADGDGYLHVSHGFDPVFDERSRVIILGSFPSVLSRRNDFYYGNPQNRFWRVMARCLGEACPQSIPEKRAMLLAHGIALWDVIASCDIRGSSDASIRNVTPVDLGRVTRVARLRSVLCNGTTAGRLYHRWLETQTNMPAEVLPSTSPANSAWRLERLVARWNESLSPSLGEGR